MLTPQDYQDSGRLIAAISCGISLTNRQKLILGRLLAKATGHEKLGAEELHFEIKGERKTIRFIGAVFRASFWRHALRRLPS